MNNPEVLIKLKQISMNYWWSFNQEAWELFSMVEPSIWQKTRNPVLTIQKSTQLNQLLSDSEFSKKVNEVFTKWNQYMEDHQGSKSWFQKNFNIKGPIAYFCAEYGIHESLPIYSGGLGVLSGDHTKSASDLGIPMVFVGLFYKNGYFVQKISDSGAQLDEYPLFLPNELSVTPVLSLSGMPLELELPLGDSQIKLRAFKADIGINSLYLLDSNVEGNSDKHKELTARLYGGDREMRISQEIILGQAGIQLLEQLQIEPSAYHMNEGHSGFFQIERIKNAMKNSKLSFKEALLLCSSNCVFTTHTPVPAGNESFSLPLMHQYFFETVKKLGIEWNEFIQLGLVAEKSDYKYFSMTVFAINVSRFYNGVSELHGKLSKKMWRNQWPQVPEVENPISHITNGIHVPTWMAQEVKNLIEKNLSPHWIDQQADTELWKKAKQIPNSEIKAVKTQLKEKLISFVKTHLKQQLKNQGANQNEINEVEQYLNKDALIIGFARRFATYKRATLIFKDLARLEKIVNNTEKPVFFIFAGKAHPQDLAGQKFIQDIVQFSKHPGLKGKILFLENYDMNISRHLISGCDVWLNNPRRPMEASGTSGQKVPINFGINFSVLDGWWRESFNGENGWSIGEEKDYQSEEAQDLEDSNNFYQTLEETILNLYYQDHSRTCSDAWIEKTKISFVTQTAEYSTHRMVQNYMSQFYAPAIQYGEKFKQNPQLLKSYLEIDEALKNEWSAVYFPYIHFDSSYKEETNDFQKYFDLPGHFVEYPIEKQFAGRIFVTTQSMIHLGVYLGNIQQDWVQLEAVVFDKDSSHYKIINFYSKGNKENGVAHYGLDFKSWDQDTKYLRFRLKGTAAFLQNHFELGKLIWY